MAEVDDDLKPVIGRYRVSDQDADAELSKNSVRARLFGGKRKKTRLGKYVLGKLIGVGGMGRVYVAHDRELDRKVALKLLKGSQWSGEEARLWSEARTLAQINHRNVVSVYEVGEAEMGVFVAMEFIDGRTLRQWVNEDDPTPKAVIEVVREAGRGLMAAHGAGIIHRDFKPDNVLIGNDGRVCVVDFGIAHDVSELGVAAIRPEEYGTATGRERLLTSGPAGTPAYMAPERVAGRDADVSGDIYSFCVSTWEALTGYLPDPYTDAPPPDPRRVIPKSLRSALERGLNHKPTKRQASMRLVLDAFDRVLHRRQRSRLVWAGGGVLLAGVAVGALLRTPAATPSPSVEETNEELATTPTAVLPQRPIAHRIGVLATLGEPFDDRSVPGFVGLRLDPADLDPDSTATARSHDIDAFMQAHATGGVDIVPTLIDAQPLAGQPPNEPAAWIEHGKLAHALSTRLGRSEHPPAFVGHGLSRPDATRLTPPEFAAMASAFYDGHRGTLGSHVGAKDASPTRAVVLDAIGGDMSREDTWGDRVTDYLDGVRAWSSSHRDGTFPADVIGLDVRALESNAAAHALVVRHLSAIVRWRDAHLPDRELWVTIEGRASQNVPSQPLVHRCLTILAAGVDRIIVEALPVRPNEGTPTERTLDTLLERLGSFTFDAPLEEQPPGVWALKFRGPDSTRALVVWRDGRQDDTSRVRLPIPADEVTVVRLTEPAHQIQVNDGLHIDVFETPTIIEYVEPSP